MRPLRLAMVMILVGFTLMPALAKPKQEALQGYGRTLWGMRPSDVHKMYPTLDQYGQDQIELLGMKAKRTFYMVGEDGLQWVEIAIPEAGGDLKVHKLLRGLLKDKYGAPHHKTKIDAEWKLGGTDIALRWSIITYRRHYESRKEPVKTEGDEENL